MLILLAAMQYIWLGQISAAEREHLQKNLQTNTQNFAADFNKEIRGAYFTFQIDPGDWLKKDWGGFSDRYKLWQSQTAYPQLIEDFYFVRKDSLPLRYDAVAQDFKSAEWTEELQKIKSKIDNEKDDYVKPVVLNTFTLLMPNYASGMQTSVNENNIPAIKADLSGYLVIKLNETAVNQLLEDLKVRYFPDEVTSYNIVISNKADSKIIYPKNQNLIMMWEVSDSDVSLFDLSMSSFKMVTNSNIFSSNKKVTRNNTQNVIKNPPPTPKMTKDDTVKIQMTDSRESKPKEVETKGLWLLSVRHTDGSLERFVTNTRRKNLAISFGILGLLAVSIILIFVSVRRAQVLAQRQLDFVSAVSHEFRTPLAVIYSAGENLSDGVIRGENKITDYGDLIKVEGKKLSAMVEQILEFAGANSGRKKYDLRETDVKNIIENAIAECQPLLKEKDFTVEENIAANLPKISADRNALSGAIQNLIVNAVKYGNDNKWLRISAENGAENIKIIIEDQGIGIEKREISKIFEPFYRSKSVVDAQIHGNGLGLSLVKQTVAAHGGKVSAESEIGKGSRFVVHLPLNI